MVNNPSEKQLNKNGDRRGMSSGSRKNLDSGRKRGNGKPNGIPITSAIRELIDKPCDERWLHVEDKGKGITWRQAIAKSILSSAVAGKPGIISELLDRLEGKVTQPIVGELEVRDTRELTDEQLTVIAAANIVKNNALGGSSRTLKKTPGS